MNSELSSNKNDLPTPVLAAVVVGILSALVVGYSFVVIKYWPQPASVIPALSFVEALWWGAIVGALTGFILGFLTDDKHFVQ
jgi:thiamine transporter ThiT